MSTIRELTQQIRARCDVIDRRDFDMAPDDHVSTLALLRAIVNRLDAAEEETA